MLKGKGIITPLQKNLIYTLKKIPDIKFFYLTGGTALSEFFLGHRRSYDLDLFTTENNLILPFSRVLEKKLSQFNYGIKVIRRFESFVEFEVSKDRENLVLHIAYDSPFRFEDPVFSDYGIKVNDYRDLITDKVLTYFGRWKHRDAVDLFFILKKDSVDNLIKMATQKDPGFDIYWFAVALKEVETFPDEISQWHVDMLVEVDIKELKENFKRLSIEIMEKIRKS
jgi:predicted nucleotidyltransferase component of viral defense system